MEVPVSSDDVSPHINVMFICSEWESSKGGLSTFNREFAVNLAKESSEQIKVHCYVCKSSEEDRKDASKHGVNLITARPLPGCTDPMEWLRIAPPELPTPDVVVGHGRKFGNAALFISHRTQCKWIHFVHVFCEELGKHKLEVDSTFDAIADNEEKNKQELELCEAANLVVAVGSRLQRKYRRSLPDIKVEVVTPGIFVNFLTPATPLPNDHSAEAEEFSIFMIGRGSFEDFAVKGYDIIGNAVASLDRKFKLTFVGSPKDEQRKIENWFRNETSIARNQLTIRGYRSRVEMKKMFREADLIVMPSRTEGFGLVALEAISAGVPVLVSSESGLAKALKEVEGGMTVIVDSDEPGDWARKIQQLSELTREERHARAVHLREKYGEMYSWAKECRRFEQMIHGLIQRPCEAVPSSCVLIDQTGNSITAKVEAVTSAQEKRLVQTNRARNRLSEKHGAPTLDELEELGAEIAEKWIKLGRRLGVHDAQLQEINKGHDQLSEKGYHMLKDWRQKKGSAATYQALCEGLEHKLVQRQDLAEKFCYINDANRDTASPSSSNYTETDMSDRARKGDLATGPRDSCKNGAVLAERPVTRFANKMYKSNNDEATVANEGPASPSSSDYTETDSNRKGDYTTGPGDKGADPSLKDQYGRNLLHMASYGGNVAIIETMLSRGLDINSKDSNGDTPLMIAAFCGEKEAVNYLLHNGADPSLKGKCGGNLLHTASAGGNVAIIKTMLSRGLDINSKDSDGNTPLMVAAFCGKMQAVNYLLHNGADPSLKGKYGRNLLHMASYGGNVAIIETMLSRGLDINSKDSDGDTPLMTAALSGKMEAVNYLLHNGADPSLKGKYGRNLLHKASNGGNVAIIETMLSRGLDINSKDSNGNTPLMIATAHGKGEAVEYLLNRGAW